jgi:hypothetical protein
LQLLKPTKDKADSNQSNQMTTKNYNGWTNYETWAVNLWIDNDEGAQSYWRDEAIAALAEASRTESETLTAKEEAAQTLADRIKEQHEEAQPEVTGVFVDLLNAALSEVNWHEIAEKLIEDAAEEAEGER